MLASICEQGGLFSSAPASHSACSCCLGCICGSFLDFPFISAGAIFCFCSEPVEPHFMPACTINFSIVIDCVLFFPHHCLSNFHLLPCAQLAAKFVERFHAAHRVALPFHSDLNALPHLACSDLFTFFNSTEVTSCHVACKRIRLFASFHKHLYLIAVLVSTSF